MKKLLDASVCKMCAVVSALQELAGNDVGAAGVIATLRVVQSWLEKARRATTMPADEQIATDITGYGILDRARSVQLSIASKAR